MDASFRNDTCQGDPRLSRPFSAAKISPTGFTRQPNTKIILNPIRIQDTFSISNPCPKNEFNYHAGGAKYCLRWRVVSVTTICFKFAIIWFFSEMLTYNDLEFFCLIFKNFEF